MSPVSTEDLMADSNSSHALKYKIKLYVTVIFTDVL